jgi:hypothetical protein
MSGRARRSSTDSEEEDDDDDVLVEFEFASKAFFSLFSGYWNFDASRLVV